MTNNHVVARWPEPFMIGLDDGTEFEATAFGTDERTDLAVLKVEGRRSRSSPHVGFGRRTMGCVSATGWWPSATRFGLGGTVTGRAIVSARRPPPPGHRRRAV